MDLLLLCQNVHQRISVMKSNNGVFIIFKTKHECQWRLGEGIYVTQSPCVFKPITWYAKSWTCLVYPRSLFSGNTSPLLRFFYELFGIKLDDLFLTFKYTAIMLIVDFLLGKWFIFLVKINIDLIKTFLNLLKFYF